MQKLRSALKCVVAVLLLLIVFVLVMVWSVFPRQYVTTDLSDYGKYTGNNDNKFPREFISSFFPESIDESFSNVRYSYRAQKNDAYAFETYLEFQIEDADVFQAYISQNIGRNVTDFRYDETYKEYIIADEFRLSSPEEDEELTAPYHIRYAKVGKILYSQTEQRIIYIAMGVYDGGIAKTDFLCEYFNRFNIDPLEYDMNTADGFD